MESVKSSRRFKEIYAGGLSKANSLLVLYKLENGLNVTRAGISVSGKVGGAVIRNRQKRRLKEILRHRDSAIINGYDIIIIVRVKAADASYRELEESLMSLLKQQKLLNTETVK